MEKEKKTIPDKKTESLPSKKIKPKIKPNSNSEIIVEEKKSDLIVKAKPKLKPKPIFNIASMLKDLRNEQTSQINEKKEEEETEKDPF